MSADIFLSYASSDIAVAETICTALESRGLTCWMASRNIEGGENFQTSIPRAIKAAKIMLLVFSARSNNSEEVKKELALASRAKLIVIPLRIEDVIPDEAFDYEFANRQWVDMFRDWERALEILTGRIRKLLNPNEEAPPAPPPPPPPPPLPPAPTPTPPPYIDRLDGEAIVDSVRPAPVPEPHPIPQPLSDPVPLNAKGIAFNIFKPLEKPEWLYIGLLFSITVIFSVLTQIIDTHVTFLGGYFGASDLTQLGILIAAIAFTGGLPMTGPFLRRFVTFRSVTTPWLLTAVFLSPTVIILFALIAHDPLRRHPVPGYLLLDAFMCLLTAIVLAWVWVGYLGDRLLKRIPALHAGLINGVASAALYIVGIGLATLVSQDTISLWTATEHWLPFCLYLICVRLIAMWLYVNCARSLAVVALFQVTTDLPYLILNTYVRAPSALAFAAVAVVIAALWGPSLAAHKRDLDRLSQLKQATTSQKALLAALGCVILVCLIIAVRTKLVEGNDISLNANTSSSAYDGAQYSNSQYSSTQYSGTQYSVASGISSGAMNVPYAPADWSNCGGNAPPARNVEVPACTAVANDITAPNVYRTFALNELGNLAYGVNDYSTAIGEYSSAIGLAQSNKDLATYYSNRCLGYSARGYAGDYDQGLDDCSKAIALNPAYGRGWYNRGKLRNKLSAGTGGDDLAEAHRLDPTLSAD